MIDKRRKMGSEERGDRRRRKGDKGAQVGRGEK